PTPLACFARDRPSPSRGGWERGAGVLLRTDRHERRGKGPDMTARIIDGKVIAADLRAQVAREVERVKRDHGPTPGLAVVLVGHDPASEVYVRSKHTQTQ